MAELLLYVGSKDPGNQRVYQDGDILCAFPQLRISCVHAQHACFQRRPDGTRAKESTGHRRDLSGLAQTFLDTAMQFRFKRVGLTEVKRVRLSDGSEEILATAPRMSILHFPGRMEYMNVEQFVTARLAHCRVNASGGKPMFGAEGFEVWYGGNTRLDVAKMTTIWNAIETHTSKRLVDHGRWPLTPKEKRLFLGLAVDDMTSADTEKLTAVTLDRNGEVTQKRQQFTDWRALTLTRTKGDIDDTSKEIDVREDGTFLRANVVQVK